MDKTPGSASSMFCFAVYGAAHAINRTYAAFLKPLELSYPQFITLHLLWDKDGQKVGELARQLGLESSTLTPLLKRLEKQGHVVRSRGIADERQVFVFLSQTGRDLKMSAEKISACMVQASEFELDELDVLVRNLSLLRSNLECAQKH